MAAWYEADRTRLVRENEQMGLRFPGRFKLFMLSEPENEPITAKFPGVFQPEHEPGTLAWEGSLRSNTGNLYNVLVCYPVDFPQRVPRAYVTNLPTLPRGPNGRVQHIWNTGKLCLFFPDDRNTGGGTTAAAIVALVAVWIFGYESFTRGEGWAFPEAPEG